MCDLEDLAVGVSFILGIVIYLAIIAGITWWLVKYHSLQCQKTALDKNAAEIYEKAVAEKAMAENESHRTIPKPILNRRDGTRNQQSKKR